jgi:hypothetical protein
MEAQTANAFECALIQAVWNHTYRLWIVRNDEDHKNNNRAVAEYRQRSLDDKIAEHYESFSAGNLPLNPLQTSYFDIPQDQLILLSYDIRCTWLCSLQTSTLAMTQHTMTSHVDPKPNISSTTHPDAHPAVKTGSKPCPDFCCSYTNTKTYPNNRIPMPDISFQIKCKHRFKVLCIKNLRYYTKLALAPILV